MHDEVVVASELRKVFPRKIKREGAPFWARLLPARNRKDFEDIPEEARRELEFIWLERVDDAVTSGLESTRIGK